MLRERGILFDVDDWSKSCSYKRRYDTEWDAKYAAERQERLHAGLRLDWYLCGYCGKWHLTEIG